MESPLMSRIVKDILKSLYLLFEIQVQALELSKLLRIRLSALVKGFILGLQFSNAYVFFLGDL